MLISGSVLKYFSFDFTRNHFTQKCLFSKHRNAWNRFKIYFWLDQDKQSFNLIKFMSSESYLNANFK